jgi:hypothetical protein
VGRRGGSGDSLRAGPNPLLDQFATRANDADLAFLSVDVDANIVHGSAPPLVALTASAVWGSIEATTSRLGVSHFIMLFELLLAARSAPALATVHTVVGVGNREDDRCATS